MTTDQTEIDTFTTADLLALGFTGVFNGGGCTAMLRVSGDYSDVLTDIDGGGDPEPDSWLWVRYAGDWREDIGEEITQADSETSRRPLLSLIGGAA